MQAGAYFLEVLWRRGTGRLVECVRAKLGGGGFRWGETSFFETTGKENYREQASRDDGEEQGRTTNGRGREV